MDLTISEKWPKQKVYPSARKEASPSERKEVSLLERKEVFLMEFCNVYLAFRTKTTVPSMKLQMLSASPKRQWHS